jgi:hypothetical protein
MQLNGVKNVLDLLENTIKTFACAVSNIYFDSIFACLRQTEEFLLSRSDFNFLSALLRAAKKVSKEIQRRAHLQLIENRITHTESLNRKTNPDLITVQ